MSLFGQDPNERLYNGLIISVGYDLQNAVSGESAEQQGCFLANDGIKIINYVRKHGRCFAKARQPHQHPDSFVIYFIN